ncbi:MAG TPA: DUF882 domain-containing protein [Candidatus Kryptonia bacterium]|nr:DUF882 domain-containing protein [Candidatus Kryptonia bacterium]
MIGRVLIAVAGLVLALSPTRALAGGRFFFSGDGTLTLEDAHSGAKLRARFRRPDGSYDSAVLAQLRHFMRSRGDDREGEVSLRLIEQLDYIEDLARPKHLRLASGYRSPAYNGDIRARGGQAASASLHTQGLAADLQFDGVNIRQLWHRIRGLGCCGVGYYKEGNFLHIDVGPPRFWEAATSKVDQNLSGGNARIFARSDFDRYGRLAEAQLRLYSVTAFPLRVANTATALVGEQRGVVRIAPAGDVRSDGDCLVIDGGDQFLLHVTASDPLPAHRRLRVRLATCEPRLERTPETFETNEIELQ